MSKKEELLTPVGRLVRGSLYHGSSVDMNNQPRVYKTGPNAGQPRIDFFFAVAFKKGLERHWAETPWGAEIWKVGHAGFPQGQANSPTFAWKIKDGDNTVPDKSGKRACDHEGYPGHWVLHFSSAFAPAVYNEDGTKQILEPEFVKLGDYVQVYGSISGNDSTQQPGVYLNPIFVAFSRYGERIIAGADPKTVGFGKSPIPAGATLTPPDGRFNPANTAASNAPQAAAAPAVPNNAPPVAPYPEILTPPVPPIGQAQAAPVMTEKAQGASFDQMIAAGWTKELLIQHGMMIG